MRSIHSLAVTLSLVPLLTACGGEEEAPGLPGFSGGPGPIDFNELQQNPTFDPDMPPMPDANDKEAMKKWTAEYMQKRMDRLKSGAAQVSEAELETWYAKMKDYYRIAKGDASAAALRIAQAGPQFHALSRKVSEALTGYSMRKSQKKLTEADKQNATLYEKYIKLMDGLED